MHPAMFAYLFLLTHDAAEQRPLCYLTATNLVAFGPQIKILTKTVLKKPTPAAGAARLCESEGEGREQCLQAPLPFVLTLRNSVS